MPTLALSTWSLHRKLGPIYPNLDLHDGQREAEYPFGQGGGLSLLETPAAVAAAGIWGLEICHFHFPSTDPEYLQDLRRRLDQAQVQLLTLLIDAGDISAGDPQARDRDLQRIREWIDVAATLGGRQVRVVAGNTPPDPAGEAMRRSIEGLSILAQYAASRSVKVITENWRALSMQAVDLLAILDGVDGAVGLCADLGNYSGPTKYEALQAILPRATTIHAKADFPRPGEMDSEDFQRCLELSRAAGFSGPYVLIFDGPGDEWEGIAQTARVVSPYL